MLQVDAGKVLIFANTIAACEELVKELEASFRGQNMPLLTLHGDKQQVTRAGILKKFVSDLFLHVFFRDFRLRRQGVLLTELATLVVQMYAALPDTRMGHGTP